MLGFYPFTTAGGPAAPGKSSRQSRRSTCVHLSLVEGVSVDVTRMAACRGGGGGDHGGGATAGKGELDSRDGECCRFDRASNWLAMLCMCNCAYLGDSVALVQKMRLFFYQGARRQGRSRGGGLEGALVHRMRGSRMHLTWRHAWT